MSDRVLTATLVILYIWVALLSFWVTRNKPTKGDTGPMGPAGPPGAVGMSGPPGKPADEMTLFDHEKRITRLEGQPWLPHTQAPQQDWGVHLKAGETLDAGKDAIYDQLRHNEENQ